MFENEIKFIADFNLNKIKSYGAFITFEKLVKSEIHPAVIQYISAELDFLVAEDRKKLLQQSIFDYSGPEVAKHFNLIAQEVKRNKKISYEDLKKLVIQAVSFNINFIVRPNWSLIKLVYNEADHKSIEEIQLALNYVYYYDFVKNIFLSYLLKRKLTSLSITEFELIMGKIDKELYTDQKQKLIDNTLFTFADFINIGGVSKTKIPPYGVELYLKEKNLTEYLIRLRRAFPNEVKQRYDIEEIRRIIFSTEPIGIQTEALEEDKSIPENEPIISEGDTLENEDKIIDDSEKLTPKEEPNKINEDVKYNEINNSAEEKQEHEEEKSILDEELNIDSLIDDDLFSLNILRDESKAAEVKEENILNEKETEEPSVSKKIDLDSLYDFEEETNELLKEFNSSGAEEKEIEKEEDEFPSLTENTELTDDFSNELEELTQKEEEPSNTDLDLDHFIQENTDLSNKDRQEDIIDILDDKDIRKIISNVFNDDRKDFTSTMVRLSECNNYEEATEILKSVFITYRVNPYSKEALSLTNSVAKFFTRT